MLSNRLETLNSLTILGDLLDGLQSLLLNQDRDSSTSGHHTTPRPASEPTIPWLMTEFLSILWSRANRAGSKPFYSSTKGRTSSWLLIYGSLRRQSTLFSQVGGSSSCAWTFHVSTIEQFNTPAESCISVLLDWIKIHRLLTNLTFYISKLFKSNRYLEFYS